MPQSRTHASQKFPGTERFGYVIIGAQFKQQDFIGDVAGSAEHHDGERGGLSFDFFAQIAAGKLGQPKVENNDRRRGSLKALESRPAVSLNLNRISLSFEKALQSLLHGRIIFDHENSSRRPYGVHRINRSGGA